LNEKFAGEIFVSIDGRLVAAGSYSSDAQVIRSTRLFGPEGKILRTFNMVFRSADISADGFVLVDRNTLVYGSMAEKDPDVLWSTNSREEVITAVKLADGHIAVAVEKISVETGTPIYQNRSLVVLNDKGMIVAKRVLGGVSTKPVTLGVDGGVLKMFSGKEQTSIELQQLEEQP
jgi:hypothetical protein